MNEYYNDKEYTSFINCTAFGKIAERLQRFNKGRAIAVVGSLRQDRWEDKSGNKQSKISVMVNRIEDLEWNKNKTTEKETSASEPYDTDQSGFYNDDIPF